jgi:CubicO group peptidase (beta-lactamase class C family)
MPQNYLCSTQIKKSIFEYQVVTETLPMYAENRRSKYRNSFELPEPVIPEEITEIEFRAATDFTVAVYFLFLESQYSVKMKKAGTVITLFILSCFCLTGQSSISALDNAIIKAENRIETSSIPSFRNLESFIVWHGGSFKHINYYNGISGETLHQVQSQTKSVVSLLMGIAIDKGFVKSEYELVSSFFPEYFRQKDTLKSLITIRDLLTMSAGFDWEEMLPFNDPRNNNISMNYSDSYLKYVLSRPMAARPFTEFKYNSGSPMIVAGIIEKASKIPLDKFAEKYLFNPLKIPEYRWLKDSTGLCHAGGGLFLKPEDMVKIGVLVLNNGRWEGKSIVPEEWIKKSSQPYFSTTFSDFSYGYFWWLKEINVSSVKTTKVISAQGAGGQYMYILPEFDLIVAFTENNFGTPLVGPFLFEAYIVPVLQYLK